MEFETPVGDKEYRCEKEDNRVCVSVEQISAGLNKTDSSDKKLDSDMKEDYTFGAGDRSVHVNVDHVSKEEPSPCEDMSLDNSKEDSDFSDYSEDNNRCQLANQALRAKLLNGVFNPTTGHESKLRVSVFDHRIIPKKLIIARKNDNNIGVDTRDNLNENKLKPRRGANVNELENANKRKGHGLSYAVLKAQRKSSTDNSLRDDKGENTKMDSDNEYRTRFDILLRNLIGDVSGMQVEPSPMTVSSGYESDYIQTREADIDKMFSTTGKSVSDKENTPKTQTQTETPTGYFSLSRNHTDIPHPSPLTENQQFTSLPSIPTQQSEKPKIRSFEEKEPSKINKPEKDSSGFSYAQRHNYKLTKVTRSMYEIIHDLQNGEKAGSDGRKRSRKGRKINQDGNSCSDGSSSARESRTSITNAPDTAGVRLPSEREKMTLNKDSNASSFSGSVVRCVRRPLVNDSSFKPAQRKPSHSEGNRLASSSSNNDCDKVQNDLRNLLCDTSDVTLSSTDNTERVSDFNTFSSIRARQDGSSGIINGHTDTGCNQVDSSITRQTAHGSRRPTLNEQFINRPRPEDHVYETIPGDEKLYEEWKKMRENPRIPKIRRYTTVPDLPGTFIPKDPPALPARRYLSNITHSHTRSRDSDDYIFMGDINSNFPQKEPVSNFDPCSPSSRSKNLLEPNLFECYPYTLHDENVFNHPVRNDETSDGYCSIDNLSLLRENVADSPTPVHTEMDWRPPVTNSIPRAPLKRSDFFLHPYDGNHNGFNLSSSHLFADRPPVSDRRTSRTADESAAGPSVFNRDCGKPAFQATYV